MDLLEREQFLAELEAIRQDVTGGTGRLVLVSGEAGIGKTSLVEHFTADHQDVLWGTCDALFTPRPLGPLYDIAHQTRGKLFECLEQQAPQVSIFSEVLNELENAEPLSLVVIEDVHWADQSTLDLLKFLGRRIHRIKSMLIVTYRDDEVSVDHPLRLVLGDLPHRSVARLRLPPLSEAGVQTLSHRAGRKLEDLYSVTGGNPFFVTEALASKETGVPVTVSDAVLSRGTRLSSAARNVLEFVSVIPARAEMWLVNETINPGTTVLAECIGSGMLQSDGDALAFRHDLARRAIEESIPIPRRQHLHRKVLDALLDRRSEAWLARIVHHAAQAGDPASVLRHAPLAARQAATFNAHRDSAAHYQTALQYADLIAPGERARLWESRSYECFLSGQNDEAFKARQKALEIWQQAEENICQADNLRWMSRINWFLGHRAEAESYSNEAVAILEQEPPSPELAMAYSNRSQLHMLADQTEEAVAWGSRAIDLAKRFGATETLIHALNNVGTAELLTDPEQGCLKLEESLRLALAGNFQEHAVRAFTNLSTMTVRIHDYPRAMRYFNEGIAYTTERDLDSFTLYMQAWRARAQFDQGDWTAATDDAAVVLAHARVWKIAKIPALAVLGHVRVRRGDPDAERLLAEALDLAMETGEPQRIAPVAAALAENAWFKGDLDRVIDQARSVLNLSKEHFHPWVQGEFAFWLWRAGASAETGTDLVGPYALQISGDWRAAAAAWKKFGCPYEQAIALAEGDEPAQLEALQIFESLGAGPAAEMLRQSLRATGVRGIPRGPRRSTKENPAGLTSRQLDVLALIVEGLSNAEIATRLFISARTVDHHVAAILAKLDARTRAEAATRALQSGLLPK
ncbi:MAG TPA: AAA family ATPase [Pyrinomonadaceae bacterium]|nr:AAA family ATPase [Pyrinomonadaceae bacterium]